MQAELKKLIEATEAKATVEEKNRKHLEEISEHLAHIVACVNQIKQMEACVVSMVSTLTQYLGAASANDEARMKELLELAQDQSAELTVNLTADEMTLRDVAGGDIRKKELCPE